MKIDKKYSEIPNLYRPEAQSIFNLENVIATEKLHGTNFSFGLVDGEPRINSRNNKIWGEIKKKEFYNQQFDGYRIVNEFKKQIGMQIFDFMRSRNLNNLLIYGEFYGNGIQKKINYGPNKYFSFFDAYDLIEDKWLNHNDFINICHLLELNSVPELYCGPPKLSIFEEILNKDSTQAKLNGVKDSPNIQEGIVIKGLYSETNKFDERIIAKYKTEKFSEKNPKTSNKPSKEIKGKKEQVEFAEKIASGYVTEARLENCLEKMRGMNKPLTIKITKDVVKYMQDDVLKDLSSELNDQRFDKRLVLKLVGKQSVKLFHDWLKEEFRKRIT